MDAIFLQRIRDVYPNGDTQNPVEERLNEPDTNVRIKRLLVTLKSTGHYSGFQWRTSGKIHRITITLKDHPAFAVWEDWENAEKLAWIKSHGGFYPVLWLTISRVADYYDYHFNDWHPRGDTGYLDIQLPKTTHLFWTQSLHEIETLFKELGFSYFSTEFARELVPGFTANGYDAILEDDPRWDDEDFDPPAVPATVWDCLWEY